MELKELIEAYKQFIGNYKNQDERKMRKELEDYSNGMGWGWDGWQTRIKKPKTEKIIKVEED